MLPQEYQHTEQAVQGKFLLPILRRVLQLAIRLSLALVAVLVEVLELLHILQRYPVPERISGLIPMNFIMCGGSWKGILSFTPR